MPININHVSNKIKAAESDLTLDAGSENNINVSSKQVKNASDPTDPQDLVTKVYVDNVTGQANLLLGNPSDGNFKDGAYQNFNETQTITDAIDDLNEVIENVRNDTFVRSVDFTGNPLIGGAGLNVTLNISTVGNANRYTINWGDGSTTTATTDTTPSHVYSSNIGSPFDVSVTAFNNDGQGSGSSISKERLDYVTIYTATPVVQFAAYSTPTGGSPITQWDDGDTIYFENTTSNTSGATVQYTWNWGDGSSDTVVSSDSDSGGVGGGRISHTFTTSNEQEQTRNVSLTLDVHTTATPSEIPRSELDSYKIYDTHSPTVTLSDTTGINEESSNGLTVSFTNTTENTIGSYSDFGITYLYTWGDGTTSTVNVGSNQSGDTGRTINHRYSLTNTEQSNGTARDYTGNLRVLSNHSNSPFISSDFTVHLEPDVRANISGTANFLSDRSGDNQYDLYDGVDYNGNNRALVTVTNSSQNADDYVYDWGDTSSNDVLTEDGSSSGTVGNTIQHDYSGQSLGNLILNFTANGTPDITAQTDNESITYQIHPVPSAPSGLSTKTIQLQDPYQGISPKLVANFDDNSISNPLIAGDSLSTSTARRYSSGTIDTTIAGNAFDGLSGTLEATINGTTEGSKTFTTALNENGVFDTLVITDQRDAHDTISSSTYPSGFYQTFDAKITQALTEYSVGVNDQRLEHSSTGNTNYVAVVRDDVTSTPVVDLSSATLVEDVAGVYRYISGIPYYDSSNPSLLLSGVQLYNWIGQAYRDTSNVFEISNGTNYESTSQPSISTQNKSYSDLDGDITYLQSGIPLKNTGKDITQKYSIGDQTINITNDSVIAIETLKFRSYNVNGTGSYVEMSSPKIQVHTADPTGIIETAIPVASTLGNGNFTDNGIRVSDFISSTTDTPAFSGTTDYYTNSPWAGAVAVSGTQEATIRLGLLKHFVEDLSTGYLPIGPDRSGDTGTQYFTFAFRRQVVANFNLRLTTSTGIEGVWIASPGTGIDSASGLNGWIDATEQYAGSGVPGSDTGNGGNGSNGCAFTGADVIPVNSSISNQSFTLTLGSENMSNATGNVVIVRIALSSGQTLSNIAVETE